MSDTLIDAKARFARQADTAAMSAARRDVIARARQLVLPRPLLPANDRDPTAA